MNTRIKVTQNTEFCPKCKSDWRGETILATYIKQRDIERSNWQGFTDEHLIIHIKQHYSPPYRFGRLIGIEVQGKYDGVSYWRCPDCTTTFNRFTGKEEKIII